MVTPAATDLRVALAAAVRGVVLLPADTGYRDACALHNAAVEHRPAAIVQVASTADVSAALTVARDRDLRVSVRGGGHGLDGAATSGDIVLDLRAMRGVTIDAAQRMACVRGGATWADLDAATGAHGLVVPGARVGSVGVAGSTLAGGTGWLTPLYGTARENLCATEVVPMLGVDDRSGSGAGDGAAAVIASMSFALHPRPDVVLGGRRLYRLADAADVISVIADLAGEGRPEFAPLLRWQVAPAAAYVPGDVVGHPVVAVLPSWIGDPGEGLDFLSPLHRAVQPLVDTARAMSYAELQRQLDDASPWGRRRAEAEAQTSASETSITAGIEAAIADRPGPQGFVELLHLGTTNQWSLRAEAQWTDRADDFRQRAWVTALATSFTDPTAITPPNQSNEKEVIR
jgi:FAD/FMN-containing dehydrogenase